jgi:signal transduction histidine kinase
VQDLLELYQNSETIQRLSELHDLLQPALEELATALGFERAFVVLVDVAAGVVQGTMGVNPPGDLFGHAAYALDEQGPLLKCLAQGRPVRVDDALRDPSMHEQGRSFYASFGIISFAAIPLLPASSVLIVSKSEPITEAEIDAVLPHAGRLVAMLMARGEAMRQAELGAQHAVEAEWLWWLVNSVQDPIILSDEQNNILLQNSCASRLLETRPEDSPGKQHAIALNQFLLTAALSSFTLDQGAAMGRELTLVDPIEGGELLFEVICRSATNLRTGQRGLVSVLKDVTDLRRAAEELKRSFAGLQAASEEAQQERDRLNLILAHVADPIVVTDPVGQIILMNRPAERLLQSPVGPAVEDAATVYLANDAKLSFFLSQLGLESTAVRTGEIELVDPGTGEPRAMGVTATEVQDPLGQVTTVVSVLHDLTESRELERRTVQHELAESQKLAAVGRLAAALAHEINNPLEAIKNSLYLLVSRTPVDDPNRRFLEIANKETERVSGIIRQMLGFYRPTALKAPTNINGLLDEALVLLEKQLRQAKIVVRCDLDRRLPPVLASADQLKQVFLNLLLNAQEAMPNGGTLRISSRISRSADAEYLLPGESALIQFQDTGDGISDENLQHIFEPFFSTKPKQRGTGMGLWISLGIVQQHGGQLKVRSRPGRGTTFTIALPVGT